MPGSKVNNYGVGDVDLTALMTTVDAQRIGFHSVSLTEWDTSNEPLIAAGSKVEINGALFKFDSDESIYEDSDLIDGVIYVRLEPDGDSVTARFTNDTPTWDDEKQGWYEPATNNRYLNFAMILDGTDYISKHEINKFDFNLIGELKIWSSNTPPGGWLLCYGQAISRNGYPTLFSIIGTTFGVGDGSTTFNLPDMRGRFPLGQDDMGGSSADRVTNAQADAIGGNAGDEDIPAHSHTVPLWGGGANPTDVAQRTGAVNTEFSFSTGTTGTGSNNMPPYLTLNYIIKY